MAARWNENIVAEHRDLQANAMSVDCTGQFAILAGKRVWAVINLDTPQDVVKKLSRQSRWEVSVVEWNPHVLQKNLFAATSNQSADIWSWADGCGRQIASLKAHTRVISDVNWSCFDSNMLATCSVDTYIYLWDIRDSRKPASALSAVAGAAQVKWNKIDSNYIATAHDGDIRIWDHRKNSTPVQYIAAHLSKIHGLDWEPKQELCLATSSQDGTVKFWDVTSPRQPQSTLNSTAPVWRARYTPFGNGLVTIVVPQLRRGENSLLLWNTDNLSVPMHTFIGHSDVVLEFQWRKFNEDSTDYQLVTWSRDHTLRLWKIDPHLQKLCGAEDFIDDVHRDMVSISPGSRHSSISGVAIEKTSLGSDKEQTGNAVEEISEKVTNVSSSATTVTAVQPQTLQQEFSLVNVSDITNVKLDALDAMHRSCKVTSVHVNNMVTLNVSFPANYPNNAAPDFTFTKPTNIDTKTKSKLLKILQETSHQHVKRNRTCLEPCIRKLVTGLETLTVDDKVQDSSQTPYNLQNVSVVKQPVMPIISYGSYRDHNIPFPRTSGARFCSVGKLVVFMRPVVKKSSNPENTPRSLSVLGTFRTLPIKGMASQTSQYNIYNTNLGSPTRDVEVSISNYYKDRDRERKIRGRGSSKHKRGWEVDYVKPTSSGMVTVYDIEIVLPIHKTLAQNYVLDHNDIPGMCSKNAAAAATVNRKDLVQIWSLASLATNKTLKPSKDPDTGPPWAIHPFGRKLLTSILQKYKALHDVQTLAMLSCAFGKPATPSELYEESHGGMPRSGSLGSIPYNSSYSCLYYNNGLTYPNEWSIGSGGGGIQSISWSLTDSPDDYRFSKHLDPKEVEKERHEDMTHIMDPNLILQYDEYKKAYSEILYRWDLKEARAEVLKYVSTSQPSHAGIEFGTLCQHCHREVKGAHCVECKRYSFQCAICHVAVKGSSNFCLSCRHGGHSHHMLEWFQTQDVCPTGCGCYCMQEDFQLYGRERTDSFSRSGHTGRERTDSFGRSGITSRERADSYGKSGFSNFL